jgi:homoserine O-acetyltransferase
MNWNIRSLFLCILLAIASVGVAQEQQFADVGDFKLESGETLRNCRIGYRTLGALNADKSNVILIPTWAGGTSEQWLGDAGPGKLADSSKYYVVIVDALSNGVSSSPSNSTEQPRMQYPRITIADMVNTQYALLTRILHITHVKAVLGVSMGGMQTFQWIVSYPDFMDKAVPVVGSPRLAAYDLLQWQAQLDAIMKNPEWRDGNYDKEPARAQDYELGEMLLTTPEHFNRTVSRDQILAKIAEAGNSTDGQDANNKIRQTQAMMSLDVSKPFGGLLQRAAAAVKARVFVIVSREDHLVTPEPALQFARMVKAQTLILENDCGHLGPSCEHDRYAAAVKQFLEE